jgi:uncharacterized protein HemY
MSDKMRLACSIFFACAVAACAAVPPDQGKKAIEVALLQLDAGKFAEAEQLLNAEKNRAANTFYVNFNLAIVKHSTGDFSAAKHYYLMAKMDLNQLKLPIEKKQENMAIIQGNLDLIENY